MVRYPDGNAKMKRMAAARNFPLVSSIRLPSPLIALLVSLVALITGCRRDETADSTQLISAPTTVVTSQATVVTLQDAIAKGLVEASFSGLGGSSGDTVRMLIYKTSAVGTAPLTVSVPPGSKLRSGSAGDQNMVIAEITGEETSTGAVEGTSHIVLRGTNRAKVILKAFCTDFEKDNPSESTGFQLESPDPILACITQESQKLSLAARQAAVWIYTDDLTFSHMDEKFDVTRSEYDKGGAATARCRASK